VKDSDEPDILQLPVALLSVVKDYTDVIELNSEKVAVVVEGGIIIDDFPSLPGALVMLYGLIYALHLDYPKKLTYTSTFIQRLIMCLDDGKPLKPCLLRLKSDLAIKE